MDRLNLKIGRKITRFKGRVIRIYKKLDNQNFFIYNTTMKKVVRKEDAKKLESRKHFCYNITRKGGIYGGCKRFDSKV